jgi:hypothetical protein
MTNQEAAAIAKHADLEGAKKQEKDSPSEGEV